MLVEVLLTKSHLPNCVTKLNLMFPGHLAQLGLASSSLTIAIRGLYPTSISE
jgi:hypothetical protein